MHIHHTHVCTHTTYACREKAIKTTWGGKSREGWIEEGEGDGKGRGEGGEGEETAGGGEGSGVRNPLAQVSLPSSIGLI